MLRRNLIAIAIIVLGLGITSVFGQIIEGPAFVRGKQRPKSVRTATIKKPTVKPSSTSTVKKPAGSVMHYPQCNGLVENCANSKSRTRKQVSLSTNPIIEAVKKPKQFVGSGEDGSSI